MNLAIISVEFIWAGR